MHPAKISKIPSLPEFADYDVISKADSDLEYHKIKNKKTLETFAWRSITYKCLTEPEIKALLARIEERKSFKHPNLLQLHSYINCEAKATIYLITEFCKYGTLTDVIRRCIKQNEHLHEEFIWKTMYQIACILKLSQYEGDLNLNNIFLDQHITIKLLCFDVNEVIHKKCNNNEKYDILNIANVLLQLCTLQLTAETKQNCARLVNDVYYSKELKEFILRLLKKKHSVTLDTILCHPKVLLKSTLGHETEVFVKNRIVQHNEAFHACCCEQLKARELEIKLREDKLDEKEYLLKKKEKRIALIERTVKEKLTQAELYLKRTRDTKSSSDSSGKNSFASRKLDYECLNTSLSAAECGDSVILPTSTKMNVQTIIKPSNFTRTMSERRIRFKGHSPLKDIRNVNHKDRVSTAVINKRNVANVNVIPPDDNLCKRISWTDETKKQAFELLRVMNAGELQNYDPETKHTHL